MKILVCVKQVPRLDQVRFQPGINRIVRDGVESTTNPLDLAALGHALALRDAYGGEVVVVTMGPPGARQTLADALALGADRGVHLVDLRFAGADTLATARVLCAVVGRERPDLVLLGRSTVDGGTAQVAPQLAELAGLSQVTQATGIGRDGPWLLVTQETERGFEQWRTRMPAVISVEGGPPPAARAGTVNDGLIEELDADALAGDSTGYGIRGSATYVQKVLDVPFRRAREAILDAAELADRIEALAMAAIEPAGANATVAMTTTARELWVVAEGHGDAPHPVTAEAIAAARAVAEPLAASVVGVVLGADPGNWPDELAAAGADRVLVAQHESLAAYHPESATTALAALIVQRSPFAVIGGWTARGRDFLPRVAARLSLGMTGDVVGLEVDPHPGDAAMLDLVWLKPAWAGTVVARVVARTVPSMGTLRPGAVRPLTSRTGVNVQLEIVAAEVGPAAMAERVAAAPGVASGPLDACAVLLLLGSRLSGSDASTAVRLAGARGWSVGGTAAAVAAGRLAPPLEVSLRKRSLSPRVVVGLGLDGAADLDAVRGAETVVTVDADPGAAVHDVADIAGVMEGAEALAAFAGRASASPARPVASGIDRA